MQCPIWIFLWTLRKLIYDSDSSTAPTNSYVIRPEVLLQTLRWTRRQRRPTKFEKRISKKVIAVYCCDRASVGSCDSALLQLVSFFHILFLNFVGRHCPILHRKVFSIDSGTGIFFFHLTVVSSFLPVMGVWVPTRRPDRNAPPEHQSCRVYEYLQAHIHTHSEAW